MGNITLPPIEDMIADRLGQYAASGKRDDEMRVQAQILFDLAGELDTDCLLRRVVEETGDASDFRSRNEPIEADDHA